MNKHQKKTNAHGNPATQIVCQHGTVTKTANSDNPGTIPAVAWYIGRISFFMYRKCSSFPRVMVLVNGSGIVSFSENFNVFGPGFPQCPD